MFAGKIRFKFVNMGLLNLIVNVLKRQAISDVQASCVKLSYVDKLFPDFKDEDYIILHRSESFDATMETAKLATSRSTSKYNSSTLNSDNTGGSPIGNWDKKDENYHPLSRTDASIVVNLCLECLKYKCVKPLIALCDGKDKHKTRLLGTMVNNGQFITLEGRFDGIHVLSTVHNELSNLWNEHLLLSHALDHQVKVATLTTFNILGTKHEIQDGNLLSLGDFEGHLCIEVDGNNFSWDISAATSKYNLTLAIMPGWSRSPLKGLWKQLMLLNEYLSIIEKHDDPSLNFSNPFSIQHEKDYQDVEKRINMLMNGDFSYMQMDTSHSHYQKTLNSLKQGEGIDCVTDLTLQAILEELLPANTIYPCELLWDELISTRDYTQMRSCFQIVTRHSNSDTTIISMARSGIHSKSNETIPLQVIIALGFEKLTRYYKHILSSAQFTDILDISSIFNTASPEEFITKDYIKQLNILLKIHICLEFMFFVQMKLGIRTYSLQTMFERCYKKLSYGQTIKRDHFDMTHSRVYKLTDWVKAAALKNYDKGTPTSQRIILSSPTGLSTTTYYSQSPIFPPTIYPTDELRTEEEAFHTIKIVHSSLQIQ